MRFDIRPRIRRAFRLALRRPDLAADEIDEELRFHVDLRVAQLMARGLTHEQADADARRRFGTSWQDAVSRLHEAGHVREERLVMRERLGALWSDVQYATRTLARQPVFTIVVIATFALGIGANATMFGVIDRLLLRPPPHVASPEQVMRVGLTQVYQGQVHFGGGLPYPFYTALLADTAIFSGAAVVDLGNHTLGSGVDAEQITGALVSDDYFAMLETRPAAGRFFVPGEDRQPDGAPLAVISFGFWQRRFGGDPAVLGKTLRIRPGEFTVVGVAPRGFTGPEPVRTDVWIPMGAAQGLRLDSKDWATTYDALWLAVYVRLRPGIRAEVAEARLRTIYTADRNAWQAASGRKVSADPVPIGIRSILPAQQLGQKAEARIARLLAVVAVLVLLIACANVANLLLARGAQRRREIAVRLALGVSRTRLLRLLMAETVVLAVSGGIIALLAAVWGVRLVQSTLLENFAWTESAFDARAVGAIAALVVATVLIAGLAPAMRASRPNVTESLKAGGREGSVGTARTRINLLIVQAALSVLLLVGTGLFVRSLRQVSRLQLGYEPSRVLAARMDLQGLGYKRADRLAVFSTMRDRVAAIPGIERATISSTHPLRGSAYGISVEVPGRDSLPNSEAGGPYFNPVADEYFRTLGLRFVEGRPITAADISGGAKVAVLSEAMARAYWPGETASGRCIIVNSDSTCTTIIGVVADAREQLRSGPPRFLVYMPLAAGWDTRTNVIVARVRSGDPARVVDQIRKAMQTTAPNLPYADVQTFEDLLAPQARSWRMGATLFALFGGLALLIASVGLYSSISYTVAQRGHEFGVRMALGARSGDVVRLVMRQGLRAAIVGVAAGLVAALLAGRFVASLLFETSPRNPQVFAAVAIVMLVVAAAASFVPAWRASRVDPVAALRGD